VNGEYVRTAAFRRTVSQLTHFMIFSEYVNLYVDDIIIRGAY